MKKGGNTENELISLSSLIRDVRLFYFPSIVFLILWLFVKFKILLHGRTRKNGRKVGKNMLGLPDASVWLAYVLSIGGALLCVVYGLVNWNKDNGEKKGGGEK